MALPILELFAWRDDGPFRMHRVAPRRLEDDIAPRGSAISLLPIISDPRHYPIRNDLYIPVMMVITYPLSTRRTSSSTKPCIICDEK